MSGRRSHGPAREARWERLAGGHTLCVRVDSVGDVLLTGPAARAVAAHSDRVTMLAGPRGAEAARMLPGVDEVRVWRCPWIDPAPPHITEADITGLAHELRAGAYDRALVFTSFHQSPLPTALLLRMAGVPWVAAISEDYPGSLLDLRHRLSRDPARSKPELPGPDLGGPDQDLRDPDLPEAERALSLAQAAGMPLPPGDDGRLQVRLPLPGARRLLRGLWEANGQEGRYVVLHPGASVAARAWPVERFAEAARLLARQGRPVVVTGTASEAPLTALVANAATAVGGAAVDLAGRTDLSLLAAVIANADVLVVGNTGPAHLAAAVGAPVVSLFAPTVPAARWAPYRTPHVLLGDQRAPCRNTRATRCPVRGHPCLTSVAAEEAVRAVHKLSGEGDLSP